MDPPDFSEAYRRTVRGPWRHGNEGVTHAVVTESLQEREETDAGVELNVREGRTADAHRAYL